MTTDFCLMPRMTHLLELLDLSTFRVEHRVEGRDRWLNLVARAGLRRTARLLVAQGGMIYPLRTREWPGPVASVAEGAPQRLHFAENAARLGRGQPSTRASAK
jgi:hypothetical protein